MNLRSLSARIFLFLLGVTLLPLLLLGQLGLVGGSPLLLLAVFVPLSAAAAHLLARPSRELAQVAERMRRGELGARPSFRLWPPYDEVAETLSRLAADLDAANRHFEREVSRRTAELTRKANQLRALGQVGQQVAAVLEPSELLHFVVRVVRGTFQYDVVAIVQEEGAHLILSACAVRGRGDVPLGRVFSVRQREVASLLEGMAGEGNISHTPCPLVEGVDVQTQLTAPIRMGERTIGAIVVQSRDREAFDEDDMFTVRTIAGQVAVALENARLFVAERELRSLAITEERTRIAREIHDTLAQHFMGILMHLRAMQGSKDPATAEMHRSQAEALAQEGLEEARRSVWNLRPERLERRGLAGAILDEAERISKRAGLQVDVDVSGDVDALPAAVAAGLLRIAQESLHNTLRHAKAKQARVRLTVTGGRAELEVRDDGIGFDPTAPRATTPRSGFGLNGMRERAHMLGGELIVDSAPGAGTRIVVRIPKGEVGRE